MVVNASERALEAMSGVLESRGAGEGEALRLAAGSEGQFGLVLDEQQEGDQVITRGERPVLYVDSEISSKLDGATLDVTDTPEGARLTLRPPE
jgi:Fe-S cluster assembly iron-binding protein IscA